MNRIIRDAIVATASAAVLIGAGIAATGAAVAPVEPSPVATAEPAAQVVAAEGVAAPLAERATIVVATPAPVEPVGEDVPAIVQPPADWDAVDASSTGARYILEPCAEEDGAGQAACYWDAAERGNGIGRSFVILEGVTYYAP